MSPKVAISIAGLVEEPQGQIHVAGRRDADGTSGAGNQPDACRKQVPDAVAEERGRMGPADLHQGDIARGAGRLFDPRREPAAKDGIREAAIDGPLGVIRHGDAPSCDSSRSRESSRRSSSACSGWSRSITKPAWTST